MLHRANLLPRRQHLRRYICQLILTWILILHCAILFSPNPNTFYIVQASTENTTTTTTNTTTDGNEEDASNDTTAQQQKTQEKKEKKENVNESLKDPDDWGSFYDPKGLFCGKYDCYKILGFDYTTFYEKTPTMKEITKSYRSLSRKYHPDKNRQRGAKERFVMIAKAYEILTDKDKREEYDYLRGRPDEYLSKYGSSVIWQYAPKSDVRIILILLLTFASLFTYIAQKQKWKTVADHLIKAAVEDWGKREGGSTESIDIRRRALLIQAEREAEAERKEADGIVANGDSPKGNQSQRKNKRESKKEKKKQTQEDLKKIVRELVYEIDDFGGGFRKANWTDVFVIKIFLLPVWFFRCMSWGIKFYYRRLRGFPYSEEELEVMTKRAIGEIAWDACTPEEHEEMKTMELWVAANLEKWKDLQEMKIMSAGERKQHARWKKRHGSKIE